LRVGWPVARARRCEARYPKSAGPLHVAAVPRVYAVLRQAAPHKPSLFCVSPETTEMSPDRSKYGRNIGLSERLEIGDRRRPRSPRHLPPASPQRAALELASRAERARALPVRICRGQARQDSQQGTGSGQGRYGAVSVKASVASLKSGIPSSSSKASVASLKSGIPSSSRQRPR
jgi:hypothetical protein